MEIESVGLLGGGTMGGGIAQVCALVGLPVTIVEVDESAVERTRSELESGRFGLDRAVERGKVAAPEAEAAKGRIRYSTDRSDLATSSIVIEAVPEDKELKRRMFTALEEIVPPETILATNTSGFSLAELGETLGHRERFLALHFFSPVPVMRPVEVVHSPETSKGTLDAALGLVDRMGKVAVVVKDAPGTYGFVANRIYAAMLREAGKVVGEGIATPEDVDTLMKLGYNWPVGPFAMVMGARGGWTKK